MFDEYEYLTKFSVRDVVGQCKEMTIPSGGLEMILYRYMRQFEILDKRISILEKKLLDRLTDGCGGGFVK